MEEYKYPMWFKSKDTNTVVKFMGLKSGTIVQCGDTKESKPVGFICDNFIPHTNDYNWENVSNLYNPLKFGSLPFSISERPKVKHYQSGGIEPIDYINSHNFNFNIGNCVKYCSRAGLKGDAIEDLQKAIHYLQFEIERLKGLKNVQK